MSRHWSEHSYLDAENLWSFIDEQSIELDNLIQCDSVESSELCKLLILGRREMLNAFSAYLHRNQEKLGYIATHVHEIITPEQLTECIKKEYGYE